MKPCTHRRNPAILSKRFQCSHPRVNAPGDYVWAAVCQGCPFVDGGTCVVEPKRLNGEWRGLGDVVADVISWLGYKRACCVKCNKRKSWLNRWFPFRRKVVEVDAGRMRTRDCEAPSVK